MAFNADLFAFKAMKIIPRLFLLSIACALLSSASAQTVNQSTERGDAPVRLEEVLKQARARRLEYLEAFKNLTADETKVTEVFDGEGRLEKRRQQIASFLVYQSRVDDRRLFEYHVVREVDGKPITDYAERLEKLFKSLADAKSPRGEWERLFRENTRYKLKYERWGVTMFPAGPIEEKAAALYDYEIAGREKLDGREMIVLSYSRKALQQLARAEGGAVLKDHYFGDRGRVWLDPETFQIHRWENEKVARHAKSGRDLVFLRDEVDYVRGSLGVLVPRRIVTEFFDRMSYKPKSGEEPRALLGGRITFTYDSFRRFDVTSREIILPVETNKSPPR